MNRALTWLFGAALLFSFIQPVANNGVWSHLRIGQAILESGRLPLGACREIRAAATPRGASAARSEEETMLEERIFDDEQRSSATLPGASRRVAASQASRRRWVSSAYRLRDTPRRPALPSGPIRRNAHLRGFPDRLLGNPLLARAVEALEARQREEAL
mgnify:CR=1 FL=1